MEVIWKNPANAPKLERGEDVKVWGLVDVYRYHSVTTGSGSGYVTEYVLDGVFGKVVEIRYSNTTATQEELDFLESEGEFHEDSPNWLNDWINEGGDFLGLHGFYRQYYEEGGMYHDEFEVSAGGGLQVTSSWASGHPGMVLLAWAEFETPKVPEQLPE
jgi:hypothetical protein